MDWHTTRKNEKKNLCKSIQALLVPPLFRNHLSKGKWNVREFGMTFPHHRNAVDIEQFHTHCLKLFFLPHSRMGASTSQVTPDEIDEATAKELAGVYWDQRKFEAAKNEQGCIPREQFEEEALAIHDRVRSKYCEVSEVFKKSLWEPLIMTSFYDILYNEEFGSFAKYDKADTTTRRILLLESFRLSEINPMTLRCDLSCDLLFHKGTVCTGSVTVTGAARDTEDKALTSTLSTEGQKEEEQKREGEEEGEGGAKRKRWWWWWWEGGIPLG